MSETATVLVDSIDEKNGVSDKGRAWTKFALKDANGEFYSTFDGSVIAPARNLIGQRVEIDYEVSGKFKNLTAIREIAQPAEDPKFGDGSYVKGKENPSTQRSISAAVALQQAVGSMTHTIGTSMTPKEASERVLPLASEYFRWLLQRTGLETDEDIPF